jgi:uncharacterized protein (TIGR02646 family)
MDKNVRQGAKFCEIELKINYCEQNVDSKKSHIEHLKPRSTYRNETYNHGNLLASCARGPREHCGHHKAGWHDEALFVTPLQEDCESRFKYLGNGRIIPAKNDDNTAGETIKRLGLDHADLRGARQAVFKGIIKSLGINERSLSIDEDNLRTCLGMYENPDADGRFQPFCTAALYFIRNNIKRPTATTDSPNHAN